MSPRTLARRLLTILVLLSCASSSAGGAPQSPAVLRVCADPNNLPFSNAREQGFDNRIARLVARELGARLDFVWWAERRGLVRNTLDAGKCDVLMGVPAGFERVRTTRAYYRSSYVFVERASAAPPVRSLDDPRLKTFKIVVALVGDDSANTPPAHALAARGIVDNVQGVMVYGDYETEDPHAPLLRAVASGAADIAIIWGPIAGYYAKRAGEALRVTPVEGSDPGMRFSIALGVRRRDEALARRLDAVLLRRSRAIDAVLSAYGVPTTAQP